jgi:hypothetical protein
MPWPRHENGAAFFLSQRKSPVTEAPGKVNGLIEKE